MFCTNSLHSFLVTVSLVVYMILQLLELKQPVMVKEETKNLHPHPLEVAISKLFTSRTKTVTLNISVLCVFSISCLRNFQFNVDFDH